MSRKNKQVSANQAHQQPSPKPQTNQLDDDMDDSHSLKWRKLDIKFRNQSQEQMSRVLDENEVSFISGPAGTGKTYLSIVKAIQLLSKENSPYKKIIIIKPAVESDEKLGALPGTLEEKLDPYIYSYTYLIEKLLGKRKLEKLLKYGIIKIMALAYLRGINIDESIVIFDEAQNCTGKQMRTLLTRIGENSKYFILGDIEQSDRFADKNVKESGLAIALERLNGVPGIGTFCFKPEDIVRNKIIGKVLEKLNGFIK